MSQLNDAKLLKLRTELAAEGHANDLEHDWLVALGATAGQTLVDMWFEVFDAAAIDAGHFNERAAAYIVQVTTPPGNLGSYNNHWLYYWENATLGPPPPPMPPLLPDLFHWYDFTDPTVLWQDTAGTVPIVDGQDILRVDDKGTEGTPVLDDFPPGPIWKLNLLNGNAGTLSLAGFPPNLQDALWGGASPPGPGVTIYSVGRELYGGAFPSNHYLQAGGPGVMGVEADPVLGDWAGNLGGAPQPTSTNRVITLGEWVWVKAKGGLSNNYEASGTPANIVGGPVGLPIGGTVTLGQAKGSVMEVLVYGRELTGPEEALVVAYFDAKYGVLPALYPPALANLQHWFDFTDNATVWADAAGTIQATNGSTVQRIDNKGYDGQSLIETGTEPQYATNFVNGLPVADNPVVGHNICSLMTNPMNAAGLTNVIVSRKDTPATATWVPQSWDGGSDLNVQMVSNPVLGWRQRFTSGGGFINSGKLIVDQEWNWHYGTIDAAGNYRVRSSGAAEVTGVTAYNAVAALQSLCVAGIIGQTGEALFYDRALTPTELTELIAYFDAKYGVMPF